MSQLLTSVSIWVHPKGEGKSDDPHDPNKGSGLNPRAANSANTAGPTNTTRAFGAICLRKVDVVLSEMVLMDRNVDKLHDP